MKNKKLILARKSLLGTSIGDAFGQSFFTPKEVVKECLKNREVPASSWCFTDDTIMTIPILESLERFGEVNQDYIAQQLATNYELCWDRGYGPSMHKRLKAIKKGASWLKLSKEAFNGEGSMGNGGAMRAPLIGAFFYDDLAKAVIEAKKSCEITHYNSEAIAGTIAVVIGAALCVKKSLGKSITKEEWLATVIKFTPESDTLYKLKKIPTIPSSYRIETVVKILGNGLKMLTQDTVPFALWNVYHYLDSFNDCLWSTVGGLGDRDTTCAIAGGIVILSSKDENIPKDWMDKVEKWENSKFYNSVSKDLCLKHST